MGRIIYTEQEKLTVTFSTLVIRLKSLNCKYGTLKRFCDEHDLVVATNGKIATMKAMAIPSDYLYSIISDILVPLGMVYNEDHVLLYEQYINWHDREVIVPGNDSVGELPLCEYVNWLKSDVRREGQFIWYAEPQLISKTNY